MTDPVCGKRLGIGDHGVCWMNAGTVHFFCGAACRDLFVRDPLYRIQAEANEGGGRSVIFILPDTGEMLRATLAPREGPPRGGRRRGAAAVFETVMGGWIGSVPVPERLRLHGLGPADLLALLEEARRFG